MGQEPRVNRELEEFLMIVVCPWLFKFKIAKIPNILTEVASYLVVVRILKLVPTKTIICTPLLVLLLKNSLILTLELTSTKSTQLKLAMNPLRAHVTLKAENLKTSVQVKTVKTAVLISVPRAKPKALPLRLLSQQVNQQLELTTLYYRREIS